MPKEKKGFGAPSPDKLYNEPLAVIIGEQEYKINRIKVKDISAVYGRIRDNRIKAILRNQRDAPTQLIAESLAHAAAIDPTQRDYWEYANTPEGIVYILWRCMAPNHPGITEDTVSELIEKESALKDLLFAESGIKEPEPIPEQDVGGENRDPFPVFAQNSQKEIGQNPQDGS